MMTLPAGVIPSEVNPRLLDYGLVIRPATGAPPSRIDKPGSRYAADVALPAMDPALANQVLSRLARARSEGLRMDWPLLGVRQGLMGAPVVNGSGAGGRSLPLRGLRPGAICKEGWWIAAQDSTGARYLHQLAATVIADASGLATLTVDPMIRAAFADGNPVLIEKPTFEGLVTSEHKWPETPDRLIPISFTIEEMA